VKIYNRSQLAKKKFGGSATLSSFTLDSLYKEIALWDSLNSRFTIKLFEVIDDPNHDNIYLGTS